MGFVYKILNTETNKEYIGSTTNYEKRKNSHFNRLKNDKHHCIHLQRSYNKHGLEAFIFEVIYEGDDYKELENKLINENYDNLYNVSKNVSGGDLISYHPQRNEIVMKMKNTINELYKDPTRRMKHSRPGYTNPNWKGGIHKIKTKCSCGNIKSETAKCCSGCRDRTGINNSFYGKKHSDKTKKNISDLAHLRYNNGYLPTNTNKIEIDGVVYKSQAEAARMLGVCDGTITHRLKSINPKYKNYKRL